MALPTDERAELLELLERPDDRGPLEAFVRARWDACVAELGEQPGFDQLRAGLLRVLGPLLQGHERARALGAAATAVRGFADDVAEGDQTVMLHRHPAWVGLCALELVALGFHDLDAVALATTGFAALGHRVARGEVLWAMAEQADDAGWAERAEPLLEQAVQADFSDPATAAQVRLVLGLRRLGQGRPEGAELLRGVADDRSALVQSRVHACAVLAGAADEAGDLDGAQEWIERALVHVDEDSHPDVAERLRSALADIEGRQ